MWSTWDNGSQMSAHHLDTHSPDPHLYMFELVQHS